jgi:tetratricopeptide (TPR) repeat protein
MKDNRGKLLLTAIITFFTLTINFGFSQDVKDLSPSGILKNAVDDYNSGDFFSAIRSLKDALSTFQGDYFFEANKYLALSYARISNTEEADKYFRVILKIRPQWKLDPEESTPEIEGIFQSTKREMSKEAGVCSCFIPGIGQIMKGENKKGIALMVTSVATLVWSIASWTITDQQHRNYLDVEPGDTVQLNRTYNRYNGWHHVSFVSTGVFIGIYLFGVYDAYHYKADSRSARAVKNIRLEYGGITDGWRIGYIARF